MNKMYDFFSKGDALKSSEVRKVVTDYVKAHELQHEQIKR